MKIQSPNLKKESQRILAVCKYGKVRSVALAYLVQTVYKDDAIAIGIADTDKDTREDLYNWADYIVAMDQKIYLFIKNEIGEKINKLKICDVGHDIYHDSMNAKLQEKILKKLVNLNLSHKI